MLAVVFCPPGKWTSMPASLLATALVADSSVNIWVYASCGYHSAFIARVRECFTLSSCVSLPQKEGTVGWTLVSATSVIQVSDMSSRRRGSVFWGSLETVGSASSSCKHNYSLTGCWRDHALPPPPPPPTYFSWDDLACNWTCLPVSASCHPSFDLEIGLQSASPTL